MIYNMSGEIEQLMKQETQREREQFEFWYLSLMMIFRNNPSEREVIRSSKKVLYQQWLEHRPERDSTGVH